MSDALRLLNNTISNPPAAPSTADGEHRGSGSQPMMDMNTNDNDDITVPVTPRSAYARKNADKLKSMVSLLMQLDVGGMSRIRETFAQKQWGMSIYEFVVTLQVYLAP
jgi:hypothetical protein